MRNDKKLVELAKVCRKLKSREFLINESEEDLIWRWMVSGRGK
jgi:hypothetical protein